MDHLTFAEILAELKSDKYAGKIVSVQDFLHKEDELLQLGEVDRTLGNEKLREDFKVDDLEALTVRTAEERYFWSNRAQSMDYRSEDKYMDAEMLVDFLLMRINAYGHISLVEANARLMAFEQTDDISAFVALLSEKPEIDHGAIKTETQSREQKTSVVKAFQDAARKEKLVSVNEFNRNLLRISALGDVPEHEYMVRGHQAYKHKEEILDGYSDNAYVSKDDLLLNVVNPEIYVNGLALAFAMASETMDDAKARIVMKAFDISKDHKGLQGLVKVPR